MPKVDRRTFLYVVGAAGAASVAGVPPAAASPATATTAATAAITATTFVLRCSFCNRGQSELKRLIAGPQVYICSDCITLCTELIREEDRRDGEARAEERAEGSAEGSATEEPAEASPPSSADSPDAPSPGETREPTSPPVALECSFCGKSQKEIKKLIAGPSVYVCNECIELCNDIIAEAEEADRG